MSFCILQVMVSLVLERTSQGMPVELYMSFSAIRSQRSLLIYRDLVLNCSPILSFSIFFEFQAMKEK